MENLGRKIPKPFEIYKHFKGKLYQILNIATHSETKETLVIYQALYGDFGVYARPLDMFLSRVDKKKYPDSEAEYRFTKVKLVSKEASPNIPKEIPESAAKAETVTLTDGEASISTSGPIAGVPSEDEQLRRAQELFIEFLDEDDFKKKRHILKAISGIATDSMINNMAASLDLVVSGASRERDVKMIDDYIRARIHFDGSRLRS